MGAVRRARVYEERGADDGLRVLVDRLWPRGVRKDSGALDEWLRELASERDVTLVSATKELALSHVEVLAALLDEG